MTQWLACGGGVPKGARFIVRQLSLCLAGLGDHERRIDLVRDCAEMNVTGWDDYARSIEE